MTAGTLTHPFRAVMRGLYGVGSTTLVPDSSRNRAPLRTVGSPGSGEGMSNFMEQNLGDLVCCCFFGEVPRHRNAPRAVIALPEPGGRAVKTKRPGPGYLVGSKEAACLLLNPRFICHLDRLAGAGN